MTRFGQAVARLGVAAALAMASGLSVHAADTVRVAKSSDNAWAFIILDVGAREEIFAKYGVDLDISGLAGDAKVQQALAASSIDFGLGSGPSMAFVAKGSMLETDGHFDPAVVEVIKDSFVEMGFLDHKPPDDQLFTTQFIPVKP